MKVQRRPKFPVATRKWVLDLIDAPEVVFGSEGPLSPHTAVITHMVGGRMGEHLQINLQASRSSFGGADGTWTAPGVSAAHTGDHRRGGGHIDDLPAELVSAILAACGDIAIPTTEEEQAHG